MNELFVQSDRIEEVADGILKMPFLTEQGSNVVLNACKQIGGWSEHTRHYPTQDIHLFKELPDLDKILKARLERVVFPKVSSHFMIDTEYDMFALFAIKYATMRNLIRGFLHSGGYHVIRVTAAAAQTAL